MIRVGPTTGVRIALDAHRADKRRAAPVEFDVLFAPTERGLKPHSLAARYAAKEALIKALGGSDGVHWADIEVASEPSGRPAFALSGETDATVAARGITALHLSLSHDAGLATAYVVAESDGPIVTEGLSVASTANAAEPSA